MKKILLVDDQAHILTVIKLSLDRNGYEVDTALDGEVALRMLRESDYDALISNDLKDPLSGQELFDIVMEQFPHRLPLLLLVSGDQEKELMSWLAEHPEVELVDKPMSLRLLVARLNEVFGYYDYQTGAA